MSAVSNHKAAADRCVAFLVGKDEQTAIGAGDVDFEYPLATGVAPNPLLAPMSSLQPPALKPAQLGDDRDAAALLREAGLL